MDEFDSAVEDFKNGKCTPERMADILYRSVYPEDDVLDMIKQVGDRFGYTERLNRTAELYMQMVAKDEAA